MSTTPDMSLPLDGGPPVSSHMGSSIVAGAVRAASPNYRLIMTTGPSPGGTRAASSSSFQLRGGPIGSLENNR